ncbi:hypothetical protein JCM8097_006211 [Rhodosporidiobolus ruineniae]
MSGAPPGAAGRVGRGWKAYESLAAPPAPPLGYSRAYTDESLSDSATDTDDDDDEPVPGAFVSHPLPADPPNAMDEPLMGRRTLFVYPVPGPSGGGGANAQERYRDASWIAAYGACVLGVVAIAIQAWLASPGLPAGAGGAAARAASASIVSTLPALSLLSLISVFAGLASVAYLLFLRRALSTLLAASLFLGPLVFAASGVVAFVGSFAVTDGVRSDKGWRNGVRWFAGICFVAAFGLGRMALGKRKQLNRAVMVGELACETVLSHPPLLLLALAFSLLTTALSLPFLYLLSVLLSLSPTHPTLASFGAAFVTLVYLWTLAIGRGIVHATVGGCVGTWYFEREGEEYQGAVEVTKASFARATGPSLGTVISFSFLLSLLSTVSLTLSALSRGLRSQRLPSLFKPLTPLAPAFGALAGYAAFFNSYALSYAGMTGEGWWVASKEVAGLLRANRTRNIRDTALLRLTLFILTTGLGLLTGLLTFLFASSRLAPTSGGYTPTLAILSYAIPVYTLKLCHDVVGDAVDALFVATHLDAENQLSHCPKAVEAFGQPEVDPLSSFNPV